MTVNEYQEAAFKTSNKDFVGYFLLMDGLMGLNGEAGECIDILKKYLFQGHDFDRERMIEELGDVAWYLAVSAKAMDCDLETIFQRNIDKLNKRYPDGFSEERSVNRNEENEHA